MQLLKSKDVEFATQFEILVNERREVTIDVSGWECNADIVVTAQSLHRMIFLTCEKFMLVSWWVLVLPR